MLTNGLVMSYFYERYNCQKRRGITSIEYIIILNSTKVNYNTKRIEQ